MCEHEKKYCPRCQAGFECKVGSILLCQCAGVKLDQDDRDYISARYADCLCAACLQEMKSERQLLHTFSSENFYTVCDTLASQDAHLASVIQNHGYPPMWTRPNTFESLVHIILEQQVSLASALAALNKLRERIVDVTPENLLALTDEEMKACYFSRQKTTYARSLATAIQSGQFSPEALALLPDDEARRQLLALKGFGNWTADIYLMFVCQRADIFPVGDLAAVNALKQLKQLPKDTTKETLLDITSAWQPWRTVATMLLWHYYLSQRAKPGKKKTAAAIF